MEKILKGSGLVAIGTGIALIGSYFAYRNVKDSLKVDNVACSIEIDQEQFKKNKLIGRKQLIEIFTESKQIIAQDIKKKRQQFSKKNIKYLQEKKYEEYAEILLDLISFQLENEQKSIQSLQENLGLNNDIIDYNIKHYNQNLLVSNIPFVDELKDKLIEKEYIYYIEKDKVSSLLRMDFLEFKFIIEDKLLNTLDNNESIFIKVLQRLVELKCQLDEIYPCLRTLVYDLFYIQTTYTEADVLNTYNKFKTLYVSEQSQYLLKQLKICFDELDKQISNFMNIKQQNLIKKLYQK